jgi:hypothetical protein
MNKLIQNIAVSAIVFSPLSLIGSIKAASAHHTSSHASTISMTGTKKTTNPTKKGKKPITGQKTTPGDTTTPPPAIPTGETPPDSTKKGGAVDPISKPGTDRKIPTTGTNQPNVPVSIPGDVPSTPVPSLPTTVPGTPAPNLPK